MSRWVLWIFGIAFMSNGGAISSSLRSADFDTRGEGRGFVGFLQQEALPWRPFDLWSMPSGPQAKILSQDTRSGALSLLVYYPPRWEDQERGYHQANEEIFILEGDLTIGERTLTRRNYVYIPSGVLHGHQKTKDGCLALHFYDRKPGFVPESRGGAKTDVLLEYRNFYEEPWSHGLLRHRSPTPPPLLIKILRLDPRTGARTWIAGILGGHPIRPWETHPTWEEGYLLEGESTVGECLPEGIKIGTYRPGGYFFRPAGIAHGGPQGGAKTYAIWLFRAPARLDVQYYDQPHCPQSERPTRER